MTSRLLFQQFDFVSVATAVIGVKKYQKCSLLYLPFSACALSVSTRRMKKIARPAQITKQMTMGTVCSLHNLINNSSPSKNSYCPVLAAILRVRLRVAPAKITRKQKTLRLYNSSNKSFTHKNGRHHFQFSRPTFKGTVPPQMYSI